MEGFLTLPFLTGTDAELYSYFDHEPAPGKVKNYLGDTNMAAWPIHRPGTHLMAIKESTGTFAWEPPETGTRYRSVNHGLRYLGYKPSRVSHS